MTSLPHALSPLPSYPSFVHAPSFFILCPLTSSSFFFPFSCSSFVLLSSSSLLPFLIPLPPLPFSMLRLLTSSSFFFPSFSCSFSSFLPSPSLLPFLVPSLLFSSILLFLLPSSCPPSSFFFSSLMLPSHHCPIPPLSFIFSPLSFFYCTCFLILCAPSLPSSYPP